jgi:peptide/nickel transport system substrate-binding protein
VVPNESDFLVASLVYEAMVVPGHQQVTPRLMSSWKPNGDLTRWTFAIADGATFHDGRPVTAEDVVWSLQRLRATPNGPSRLPDIDADGIRADGDRSVVLVSGTPNADLPVLVRLQTFILPKGTADPAGGPGGGAIALAE